MKQKNIAKKYGISAPLLSAILNGRVRVKTIKTASRLSQILNMPIEEVAKKSPVQLKARFIELHELGKSA